MALGTKNKLRQVLAKNVFRERRRRRLTQDALADLARTTQKTISKIEGSSASTGVDIIERVAAAFGMSPDQLLKDRKV